ncbi:MAG: hypothetical protein LBL90_00555 [Prevotellaceae bacterium]|nr:hypothetical protein [Prevotellaceae bacterium]
MLAVEKNDIEQGAAQEQFSVIIVKLEASNTSSTLFKTRDIIYCKLIPPPTIMPEVGLEYVFKAKSAHPAHAKGVYMLETNVQDLV